jgi:uncharacterized protein with HEPN domain
MLAADLIRTRHRLVHDYFDVDLDIVWSTVILDIPPLLKELEAALERDA